MAVNYPGKEPLQADYLDFVLNKPYLFDGAKSVNFTVDISENLYNPTNLSSKSWEISNPFLIAISIGLAIAIIFGLIMSCKVSVEPI